MPLVPNETTELGKLWRPQLKHCNEDNGRRAQVLSHVHVTPMAKAFEQAAGWQLILIQKLEACRSTLWGTFFAVKDNIDVAGMPSTAACPQFKYTPAVSAPAVQALLDAGCICIGKVNMDQFAAGLNGTRSPLGAPKNCVDSRVIPGGSSSGTGAAVAAGVVTFALGTDTAGSGRVPAGFQGVVGIKPSVGLISTRGVLNMHATHFFDPLPFAMSS